MLCNSDVLDDLNVKLHSRFRYFVKILLLPIKKKVPEGSPELVRSPSSAALLRRASVGGELRDGRYDGPQGSPTLQNHQSSKTYQVSLGQFPYFVSIEK